MPVNMHQLQVHKNMGMARLTKWWKNEVFLCDMISPTEKNLKLPHVKMNNSKCHWWGDKNRLLIIKHYTPQVTKGGKIIDEKTYRLNMAKKEHRKHVRDLLATAIVHKTLDVEVRICIYVYVALSLVFLFFFYPLTLRVKQWCSVVLRWH